ncbi:MAG: histidine phosphatase family protein, partial [Clostridium sp.]
FEEADEKYHFQKEYCDTCALLDETNEAENYETAIRRVMNTISDICSEHCSESGEECNLLIVIHGGILRLIIDYLDNSINVREMNNSCICKLVYNNGDFMVESVNDMSYSENGKKIRNEKQ